ncbi:MAG: hypothetical protein M1327_04740 [Candidatus Thermoplasmatota archaeon]|nr:hypothetical protein [Candidatus Thermoplasmatota archaeon]
MRLGIYVHPWDLADEGAKTVLHKLASNGIEFINLAVSYHSGRFFLPHNPRRKIYNAEEGVVYFDPARMNSMNSRIHPIKSKCYPSKDILKEAVDTAKEYSITVNAWTVCLHNAVFARDHSELAVENMYGEADPNLLCPVKSDSRKYVASLISSLGADYEVGEIELESAFFPSSFLHGAHHEVMGIRITPVMSYLLSTCFCQDCITNAKGKGIDLKDARDRAIKLIHDEIMNQAKIINPEAVNDSDLTKNLKQSGFEDIMSYKKAVSRDLLSEYSEAANQSGTGISIVSTSKGLTGSGIDLDFPSGRINGLDLIAYFQNISDIRRDVAAIRKNVPDHTPIRAGININYPYAYNPSRLNQSVEAALSGRADSIIFYNYGWATENIIEELNNLR